MEINNSLSYISFLPQYLTEKTTKFLSSNGFNVTERWTSTLLVFFSLFLIFVTIKFLQKVNILIKVALIGISILIILGLLTPW